MFAYIKYNIDSYIFWFYFTLDINKIWKLVILFCNSTWTKIIGNASYIFIDTTLLHSWKVLVGHSNLHSKSSISACIFFSLNLQSRAVVSKIVEEKEFLLRKEEFFPALPEKRFTQKTGVLSLLLQTVPLLTAVFTSFSYCFPSFQHIWSFERLRLRNEIRNKNIACSEAVN